MGDDLVIAHEDLAIMVKHYYRIIGVEIQDTKSKSPVGSDNISEFCSRISINGVESSRISPNVILNASRDWRDIPTLLLELKKREVNLDTDLLASFQLLSKLEKNGKNSYLSRLNTVLQLPVMGVDLSKTFQDVDGVETLLPDHISPWQLREVMYNVQLIQGLDKVNKAIDAVGANMVDTEDWMDLTMNIDKVDLNSGYHFWHPEGNLHRIALRPEFKVKGYNPVLNDNIPHPASIAAVETLRRTLEILLRGLPGLETLEDPSTRDESIRNHLKTIGKLVAAILPKEAGDLVPTQRDKGTEFIRNQVFIINTIVNRASEGWLEVQFGKELYNIVFALPSEKSLELQNLVID